MSIHIHRPAELAHTLRATVLGWTPPFRGLVAAQVAHAAGNAAIAVALANTLFFAVPLGEARGQVALYLLLTMAPFAVLAPLLGRLVDGVRVGARLVLVASGILRVIAAFALTTRTDTYELFPLALVILVTSRAYGITRVVMVPEVIPPGASLLRANTWLAVASSAGGSVGAAVAAVIVYVGGSATGLVMAGLLFLFVTVLSFRLPKPAPRTAPDHDEGPHPTPVHIPSVPHGRVVAAASAVTVMRLLVGYITFFLAFALKDDYSASALAIVLVTAAIGAGVGSALAPTLQRWLPQWVLPAALLVPVAIVVVFATSRFTVTSAAAVAGTIAFTSAAARLAFDSELQHSTAPEARGRLLTRYETIFQLAWVLGAALSLPPLGVGGGLWLLLVIVVVGSVVAVRRLVLADRRGVD